MTFSPEPMGVAVALLAVGWIGFVFVLGGGGRQWLHQAIGSGAKLLFGFWLVPWGLGNVGRGDLWGLLSAALGVVFFIGVAWDVADALRERRSKDASDASAGDST